VLLLLLCVPIAVTPAVQAATGTNPDTGVLLPFLVLALVLGAALVESLRRVAVDEAGEAPGEQDQGPARVASNVPAGRVTDRVDLR
jgi:hypothetical protein